jgi:hypothetical protein
MLLNVVLGIVSVVALVIVVLVVLIASRPAAFRISRSETIAAPAAAIFPHVNELHAWEAWSPFEKLDPALKRTYEGPATGVGASYAWSGNSKAGEGRSTITESHPNDLIRLKLQFTRPFSATNAVEFTFKPEGNQTVVTWAMTGENGFMGKAFDFFVTMDKMVGSEFAKGLAAMKSLVESNNEK